MTRKRTMFALALLCIACACAGGNASNDRAASVVMLPKFDNDLIVWADVPADTIGAELSGEGIGTRNSAKWQAPLSGFTQKSYSQALGFKPGTKLTILNISDRFTHTLNVVEKIAGPPAAFPRNPKLSVAPKGNKQLEIGYASGPIGPHKKVTVTLVKRGIYLIGCAYHYRDGMRDVLVVSGRARPGKQATPPPSSNPR